MKFNTSNRNRDIAVIVTIAAMVVIIAIILSLAFEFNIVENLVMSWILTTFYSIFAFWIVREPITIAEVEKPVIQRIEVIREVPIQIPIENRTIEVVEMPVIQRIEVPVIKMKKLNMPKFKYLASTETKTFHKRNCRFGKLIKKKYKVHNNKSSWFKKNHFKACKVCIKK